MKIALLTFAAWLSLLVSAYAQVRNGEKLVSPGSAMVRIPLSSMPDFNPATQTTTRSTYPKQIRQDYDPLFADPTQRNNNLRR